MQKQISLKMQNFSLDYSGVETQCFVNKMAQNVAGPGTPGGIIKYLDYSDQQDNSHFVLELANGILQPVEVFDEDAFLSQIDLEKLVQEAENSTKDLPQKKQTIPEKAATDCFVEPTNPEVLELS